VNGYLVDENLPTRLRFVPSLPLIHATALGPQPTDSEVWEHARINDLVIVTKDADFSHRILTTAPPPRVVHLRFGNLRRSEFHELLARVWPRIEALSHTHKLVNVEHDRIVAVA
jgi:predicted nuclease of predicted toxin-antitoxin system